MVSITRLILRVPPPVQIEKMDAATYLAEFERALIRARTGEGRARAKAVSVHMGRPPKLTPHQRREALARREAGETSTEIARTFGVSYTTVGRL